MSWRKKIQKLKDRFYKTDQKKKKTRKKNKWYNKSWDKQILFWLILIVAYRSMYGIPNQQPTEFRIEFFKRYEKNKKKIRDMIFFYLYYSLILCLSLSYMESTSSRTDSRLPWLLLSVPSQPPLWASPLVGILCLHRADEWKYLLLGQQWYIHVWESTRETLHTASHDNPQNLLSTTFFEQLRYLRPLQITSEAT